MAYTNRSKPYVRARGGALGLSRPILSLLISDREGKRYHTDEENADEEKNALTKGD